MKLGIMQPYFFPYIGYWQLMNAVDTYVIYDNIQFTKSSWIRRNRILSGGTDKMFTLPLRKDSDYLDVCDRFLSDTYVQDEAKILGMIEASYRKAPMFKEVFPIIYEALKFNEKNLFKYIFHSVRAVCAYLGIETRIVVSSTLDIDHSLKGKDKVLAICRALGASQYYNAINGIPLYEPYRREFAANGIQLSFLKTDDITYKQFSNEFIPNLSIIDVMMFNSVEEIRDMLNRYKIINGGGARVPS